MYVLQGKNYLPFSLLAGTLNAHPSHYNEITNVFFLQLGLISTLSYMTVLFYP